ncbi:SIAL protein, partial [Jacana jacana]|nr:SIAL protein [Jacana jacana]
MRTVLVFTCLVGMVCAFSVKSWLRRDKSENSEENAVFKIRHRYNMYRYAYMHPLQQRYQGSDSSEEEGDGSEEEEGAGVSTSNQQPGKQLWEFGNFLLFCCQGPLKEDKNSTAGKGSDSENEDSDENEEEEEVEEEEAKHENGTSTNSTEGPDASDGNSTTVAEESTGTVEEEAAEDKEDEEDDEEEEETEDTTVASTTGEEGLSQATTMGDVGPTDTTIAREEQWEYEVTARDHGPGDESTTDSSYGEQNEYARGDSYRAYEDEYGYYKGHGYDMYGQDYYYSQ